MWPLPTCLPSCCCYYYMGEAPIPSGPVLTDHTPFPNTIEGNGTLQ